MSSLRVIFITPSFHPRTGGVEKHVINTAVKLAELGHEVTILVRFDDTIPLQQSVMGLRAYRLPKQLSRSSLLIWALLHIRILLRANVIHSHDVYIHFWQQLFPKKRFVHTFHGYEGYPVGPDAIKARQFIRSRVPICIGIGQFIEKWYGTPLDYVIYGATEQPVSDLRASVKTIQWDALFFGRLENDTGFAAYLEGFDLISKRQPKAKLMVLGSGSLSQWAKDYIEKHGLSAELHDPVESVLPYLDQSSVAFVSGYLSIIEAGSRSIPIIAYYGTPIKRDYLDCHPMSKNFSIANSAEDIANHYFELIDPQDKQAKKKLATMTSWSSKQTWDKVAALYDSIYKSGTIV